MRGLLLRGGGPGTRPALEAGESGPQARAWSGHGNGLDETRRVTLEIDLDRHCLDISVRDEGQGFDPSRLPDPFAPENLCRTSGRWVLLMKADLEVQLD